MINNKRVLMVVKVLVVDDLSFFCCRVSEILE